MINKHKILAGLVNDNELVRVIELPEEFDFEDVKVAVNQGGVVGNLDYDGDRYFVTDLDEDPKTLIVQVRFPVEKFLAVFNMRYQPVIALLK